MIELSKTAWHTRWFLLWDRCWAEFTDGRGVLKDERTNLCTYFWVSIGAPVFIAAIHIAVLAFIIWAIPVYGISHLTLFGFLVELAIVASAIGLFFGMRKLGDWLTARPAKPKREKPKRAKRGPGVFSLFFQYLLAIKRQVCPIIVVGEKS